MYPLSGAMPYGQFGSTSVTTQAPTADTPQNGGGMLSGMPAGIGGLPGMASNGYGAFSGGGSAMAGPLFWAALIGAGKNLETSNANNGLGMGLLGGLAPSGSQIAKDPVGMGLPTLLGAPFLTPFTGSKAARDTRPEWDGFFRLGQY